MGQFPPAVVVAVVPALALLVAGALVVVVGRGDERRLGQRLLLYGSGGGCRYGTAGPCTPVLPLVQADTATGDRDIASPSDAQVRIATWAWSR
ncbi:hypothetical protein SMICM304S_05805 [Streptomyces microflavus]